MKTGGAATRWLVVTALSACSDAQPTASPDASPPDAAQLAPADAAQATWDGGVGDAGLGDGADATTPRDAAAPPYINPALASACGGRSRAGKEGPVPRYQKVVLSQQPGAAYITPADLDDDGAPEFLLTSLTEGLDLGQLGGGPPLAFGGAYVLARQGTRVPGQLGTYDAQVAFDRSADVAWPNASTWFDLDNDGVRDWVIGAGFLLKPVGALVWMPGMGDGSFGPVQSLAIPDPACWYHEALPTDIDRDGDTDFVTTCHVGSTSNFAGPSRLSWFENPGDASADFVVHEIGAGGGALITLLDLDGDGDEDVIAPQFFEGEPLVWFEQRSPDSWTKHVIDDRTGRGFVVRLADVDGDGRTDLVYGNHNNEVAEAPDERIMGIYWFAVPSADEIHGLADWSLFRHTVYEGFEVFGDANGASAGAPGMLEVTDLDGDCDIDITASGDGDLGLYAFVQGSSGFARVTLDEGPGNVNSGEQRALDLDQDGDTDIVWAVFGPNDPALLLTTGLASRVYAFLKEPG